MEGVTKMKKNLFILILIALMSGCSLKLENSNSSENSNDLLSNTTQSTTQNTSTSSSSNNESKEKWELVFADEFDYEGEPDQTYWGYETGGGGYGNNEKQNYTDRRENSNVADGNLTITALQEKYGSNNYTSAKIVTTGKINWKYGRIDVRAKVPTGKGTWPAIWMMPEVCDGGWPRCGEIDIMEHVGYDPNKIHGTIHTYEYNHKNGTQKGNSVVISKATSDFVVYSFVWRAEEISWYADDVLFNHYTYTDLYKANTEPSDLWPFNKDYRLMLNLAIGGDWGGAQGIDNNASLWPHEFVVDYVRVYKENYTNNDDAVLSTVENLKAPSVGIKRASVKWDIPAVENGFKKYNIYLNNKFYKSSELSSLFLTDLAPGQKYDIDVEVVDQLDKVSPKARLTINTKDYPTVGSIIEAEDYIENNGTQIQVCEDVNGGYNLAYIAANNYTTYEVYLPETKTYKMTFRVATQNSNRSFEVYQNNTLKGTVKFGSTGGWQKYTDIIIDVSLTQGNSTIKLLYKSSDMNINYFKIE